MDDVELDLRYVGVKGRRKRKAFDRREWASVMRAAKARHKGQHCQRIRGREVVREDANSSVT